MSDGGAAFRKWALMKPRERGARLVSSSVVARNELLVGTEGEAVDLFAGRDEIAQVGVGQDGAVTAQRLAPQLLVDLEPEGGVADVDLLAGQAQAAAVVGELLKVPHDVTVGGLAAVDLHDAVGLGAGLGLHDQLDVVAAAKHHIGGVAGVAVHVVERQGELTVGSGNAALGGQLQDLDRLVAQVLQVATLGQCHGDELLAQVGLRRGRRGRARVGRAVTAAAVVLRGTGVAEAGQRRRSFDARHLGDRQEDHRHPPETQQDQERLDVPRLRRRGSRSCGH